METISFQIPDGAFQRFAHLSKLVPQNSNELFTHAFEEFLDNMEDYLKAKAVLESDEPFLTLEEVRKEIELADQGRQTRN